MKEELKQKDVRTTFGSQKQGNSNNVYSGNPYDASKLDGRNMRCVWEISTVGSHEEHCAMFPKTLIERPIQSCCPADGVVIDPFCGSGTVLEYCFEHDTEAIGIEINPNYKQIIDRRSRQGQTKLVLE